MPSIVIGILSLTKQLSYMFYPDLRRCTVHDECTFLLVFLYLLIKFDKRKDKKGQFPYQTKNIIYFDF